MKSKLIDKYKSISKTIVRLDTISTLIDNYYKSKLVPQNSLLSNYATYQDQIKTNRQAALVKLSTLQNIVTDFNCTTSKDEIKKFKNQLGGKGLILLLLT